MPGVGDPKQLRRQLSQEVAKAKARAQQALGEQLAELPQRPPRTPLGKAIRALRRALDRRALAAVLLLARSDVAVLGDINVADTTDEIHALLDTRRASYKSARQSGFMVIDKETECYRLTDLGESVALLLMAARRSVLESCFLITWEKLLGAVDTSTRP